MAVSTPSVPLILSVVIPAYNEAGAIERCLRMVLRQPLVLEVIEVDDGSSDGTAGIVTEISREDKRVRLLRQERNRGKGAALRTGFALCAGATMILQDADLEYDPADYTRVLEPILAGRAELSLGSRFLGGSPHRVLYFWHSVGNKILTLISNCFTGLNLTDMECCFKGMTVPVLRRLRLQENRFGIEPEIVVKLARLGVSVYEVPISYHGRTCADGKKIGWRDGIRALWCILKYSLIPR